MPDFIQSVHNPFLQDVRRAASRNTLTEEGCALAEGFHLLEEALRSGAAIHAVIASAPAAEKVETHLHHSADTRIVVVPEKVFEGLATSESPQGVLTLVRLKEWTLAELKIPAALLLLLDQIQDPGNAGAMIRAAEAFGATGVIFLKGSVRAYNPKALRGSAGSIFRLPVVERVDADTLLEFLHENGIAVVAAMPRADRSLDATDLRRACAIAIGSESHGVGSSLAEAATPVRIPTFRVESLNAATAAAVVLYEAQRQRSSK